MKWFRLWTEARTDAKLRLLTNAEFRVWFHLLCFAAEQEPRGSINGVPNGKLAAEVSGGKPELLERTLEKLTRLHIVEREGDRLVFIHFGDRQYEFESEKPKNVKKRKGRMKERQGTT